MISLWRQLTDLVAPSGVNSTIPFLTYWFVLFALATLVLYWAIPQRHVRIALMLLASVVFHTHFAGPAGVLPILVLAVLVYLVGLTRRRVPCALGIAASVASLLFYKYTRFLCADLLGLVFPGFGGGSQGIAAGIMPNAPPLAISFFVFEFVHYLYDVYQGEEPIRNPINFALFSIFWPSIVAGPVKRYQQFLPEIHNAARNVSLQDVSSGSVLIAFGLVKKFLADNITAWIAFWGPNSLGHTILWRWMFFGLLCLRILWDFSGYSDMALGFARLMGVRLPANFNWPYLATSLDDFWKRWHISLSSWIRDYVYIPMGGSRCGPVRKVLNGFIAFALCGLWHGAAWNFVVWGLYHGIGLAIVSSYEKALGRVGRAIKAWFAVNRVAGWALTMFYVGVGWLFFFYPLPEVWKFLWAMFDVYS